MTHLIYGAGRIETIYGNMDGQKCLMLRDTKTPRTVGTSSAEIGEPEPRENFDVIISFANIEGARVLQDQLGEMLAKWSREQSPVISITALNEEPK